MNIDNMEAPKVEAIADEDLDAIGGGGHEHCRPSSPGGEWYVHGGMGLHKH